MQSVNTLADISEGAVFTPRVVVACARGCSLHVCCSSQLRQLLDGLLATLRAGSAATETLYSMMADAQAQAFEQNMTSLGQSLVQWRQRAQSFFDASPNDPWAYDSLCVSMLPRNSSVDVAGLRADRNLWRVCQQLATAKKTKASSVGPLQPSKP